MNKILAWIAILAIAASFVSAAATPKIAGVPDVNVDVNTAAGQGEGAESNVQVQTSNQGAETNVQVRQGEQARVQAGAATINGQQIEVRSESGEVKLDAGDVEVRAEGVEVSVEGGKVKVKLSNGKGAEIKVMPSTASEKAIERLGLKVCSTENNCVIQIKEVGSGTEVKAAYEVQVERHAKLLGLFATKMQVRVQVDAENGEVVAVHKPWWAFIAAEPAE